MAAEAPVTADTKDWTWVLTRPCEQCGQDVRTIEPPLVAEAIRDNAANWRRVLDGPAVGARPAPGVWSPLEYACHVRDVHRVFATRVSLILEHDDPLFENWDQDAAASDYGSQRAQVVAAELAAAAANVARRYDQVTPAQWPRPGRRSNGSTFTLATLAQYHLHDVLHHLWDVEGASA